MSILLWLLCVVAMAVALLMIPHTALLAALVLFVAAPMVSWLVLLLVRRKVRIRLTAPGVAGKNKPFTLETQLESDARLPFGKTVMWLELTNAVTGETQKKRIVFRGSGEWTLQSAYCGCIECRTAGVWCYSNHPISPEHAAQAQKWLCIAKDSWNRKVPGLKRFKQRFITCKIL